MTAVVVPLPQAWGATQRDWDRFTAQGLTADLLPVVSRPGVEISERSKLKDYLKTPSLYNSEGKVTGIAKWTLQKSTADQVERWARQPDYGVCIQTRWVRGFDIDIDDRALSDEIAAAIEQDLGVALPRRRRANSGKQLLAVKVAGEFGKVVFKTPDGAIEVLCNGQQFIAAGTHKSGTRYEWTSEDIPEITPEQFASAITWLETFYGEARRAPLPSLYDRPDIDVPDPVVEFLEEQGLVLGHTSRGYIVECPWVDEHSTGEAGDGSTMWLPAGTQGHPVGHFRCLHGHCEGRSRGDFLAAVGYQEPADFDVIEETPEEKAERAAKRDRFEIVPAADFARRPPPRWIVDGVIPEADLVTLYGESGAGKSFVALDIGMAIARGVEWRGLTVRQGRVVYLAAEGGGGFRNRLVAYAHHHQVDLDGIPFGIIHATPNILAKDDVKALEAVLDAARGAEVIVIDTFAQVTAGANENAAEDMGLALRNARRLGEASGAVVILVHHAGKDVSKGARGWSGIRAASDAEIEVVRTEAGRWIRTTKQKDGDDSAEWGFELGKVLIGEDERGKPIESCVVLEKGVPMDRSRGRRKAPAETSKWQVAVAAAWAELSVGGGLVSKADLIARALELVESDLPDHSKRYSAGRAIPKVGLGVKDGFVFAVED